jgi:hypothetical protein
MLQINHCITTRSKITELQATDDNSIIYSTLFHGVKVLNLKNCETAFNISNQYLNSTTTSTSFSPDGQFIAFSNKNIIYILYIPTHKIIKTIITHDIITILTFDETSTYIICGTKHGRVVQYRYNNSSSLSRLCSFPIEKTDKKSFSKKNNNYVSVIHSYKEFIATSGYGGSIVIINILSRTNNIIIKNGKNRIDALCFVDNEILISGDSEGVLSIIPFKKTTSIQTIATPFSQIKQILLMPNSRYILVSSQTKSLAIIDIQECKIVEHQYLLFKDNINKIALSKSGQLLVALHNQELFHIEIPTIQQLESFVAKEELNQAFELIANSPMLQNSQAHKELEKKYHTLYLKAIEALTYNNIALAKKLISSLENNHYKGDEIKLLFEAFEHFSKFNKLFLEKKYPLAYAMSTKYPPFIYTPQYKKMEIIWKETFANAQRQMILKRNDLATGILQEHMTTTVKRPLIKFILNHTPEFLQFLRAIDKKDFTTINTIVTQNNIFSQIPNYITLINEIEENIIKVQRHIYKGEVNSAIKLIKELIYIPQIKTRIESLHYHNQNMIALLKAYKNNDFILCYKLLDKYPYLDETELGVKLEQEWSKQIQVCENFALQGDIKNIKLSLGNLIKLPTRTEKIGDILRVSYHVKIKFLLSRKSFKKAEAIINSYMEIFGIDNEIEQINKKFEKETSLKIAILENHKEKLPRDNWLHSEFILNMVR